MTPVKLTDNGMKLNVETTSASEIRAISQPVWDAELKQKHEHKESQITDEEPEETTEDMVDEEWKNDLKQKLKEMDPYKFEIFCRGLLKKMGITVDTEKGVKRSNDGGIDGYGYSESANLRTERVALQCKRFNDGSVSSKSIDELKGAIASYSADYGIFITTSSFTKSAIEKSQAGRTPVTLIDGDKLIELIDRYEYRVRKVQYCIPDDDIWEN